MYRSVRNVVGLVGSSDQPRITDSGLAKRLDGDSSITKTFLDALQVIRDWAMLNLKCAVENERQIVEMKKISEHIPGYSYGTAEVSKSPISMEEFEELKISAGVTEEDERCRQLTGEVLADQSKQIVDHWRNGIFASIPNLSRHSRTPEGGAIPEYSMNSGLRFQQWILDTCLRPYDQDWLNYQHEIALRHTTLKKNQTDNVRSTPYVPLRDIIAFVAVMNETITPYLATKKHSIEEVEKMHRAWCKSIELQLTLWARPYTDASQAQNEW